MLNKRTAILVLTGLNLFLLAALILSSYSPPAVYGQVRGRPGDYMMATMQIHEDRAAVAVINGPQGVMGVFAPHPQTGKLGRLEVRNLTRDFNTAR